MTGGTRTWETRTLKFDSRRLRAIQTAIAFGGRRRFEADREEDDPAVGVGRREVHGVERRIDDPDVAALRLELQEVAARAGDAQHVAERAEDHSGPRRDRVGAVDRLQRSDADRAAGPVDQLELRRQDAIEPVLDDAVRLAAADLHDGPRPRDGLCDRRGQLLRGSAVPIFVQVLHGDSPPTPRCGRRRLTASERRVETKSSTQTPALFPGDLRWFPQLVELIHLFEELEHATRLGLVDARQREADVDEHVVVGADLGDMLEADAPADPAELDFTHQDVVFAIGLEDSSRDRKTHR